MKCSLIVAARATRKWCCDYFDYSLYARNESTTHISSMYDLQETCDQLNLAAVLEALREPSEGMLAAARHRCAFVYNDMVADIWRAMVDAAIAEVKNVNS